METQDLNEIIKQQNEIISVKDSKIGILEERIGELKKKIRDLSDEVFCLEYEKTNPQSYHDLFGWVMFGIAVVAVITMVLSCR
jgi:hypothetical protein